MSLSRRTLLAAPLIAAAAPPGPGLAAMFRPNIESAFGFVPLPLERVAFSVAGLDPSITLPAERARLAALLPIAARQVALLAFGADPCGPPGKLDLGAIVGWDGARLRVLALEVLRWDAPGGGSLDTRVVATGDRAGLALHRDAAAPRGAGRWQRESWIDLLAWRDGAALIDTPVRTPLPWTWQARLAAVRARVAARLAEPCQSVADDVIRLIAPADLPPG